MLMDMKKYKISLCTVCMNRLHHLKVTLPKNIEDNLKYGNVEFVILDYNSSDELEVWIKTEMAKYLEKGIVNYFKTDEPTFFLRSHAKNVVSRCASGEIICNVDADNFTGKGFVDYVNNEFNKSQAIFMATNINNTSRDSGGRICMKTSDFHKISGYDESMTGYGFEDEDLKYRLEMLPLKRIEIEQFEFVNAITHNHQERMGHENVYSKFERIFIRHIDFTMSNILLLGKNHEYYLGTILYDRLVNSNSIDNLDFRSTYRYSLMNGKWEMGKWKLGFDGVVLENTPTIVPDNKPETFNTTQPIFKINGLHFLPIDEKIMFTELTMLFSELNNQTKMKLNLKNNNQRINYGGYGKASLLKNFKEKIYLR